MCKPLLVRLGGPAAHCRQGCARLASAQGCARLPTRRWPLPTAGSHSPHCTKPPPLPRAPLPPGARTGLQPIRAGAGKHLVNAQHVEGVHAHAQVESILARPRAHVLVGGNARRLQRLAAHVLLLPTAGREGAQDLRHRVGREVGKPPVGEACGWMFGCAQQADRCSRGAWEAAYSQPSRQPSARPPSHPASAAIQPASNSKASPAQPAHLTRCTQWGKESTEVFLAPTS